MIKETTIELPGLVDGHVWIRVWGERTDAPLSDCFTYDTRGWWWTQVEAAVPYEPSGCIVDLSEYFEHVERVC